MSVRPARPGDMEVLIEMRAKLWPEHSGAVHRREAQAILEGRRDGAIFLAVSTRGELIGFIEVGLRAWAEGCATSPVGYVEGWYMEAGHRRQGHGRDMLRAAEDWARARGLKEMGSDTADTNRLSKTVHKRLGYDQGPTIVTFRKSL